MKCRHCTHTLPNVNAKVSMDVCISPNIAFVFSGATSLKLIPVMSDKIEKEELEPQLHCTTRGNPSHSSTTGICNE